MLHFSMILILFFLFLLFPCYSIIFLLTLPILFYHVFLYPLQLSFILIPFPSLNYLSTLSWPNGHPITKAAKKIEVEDIFFFPNYAVNSLPQSKSNTIYFSYDPISKQCSTHHGVFQSTDFDFTDAEDELLLQYVSTFDTPNWFSIANKFTDKPRLKVVS